MESQVRTCTGRPATSSSASGSPALDDLPELAPYLPDLETLEAEL